MSPSIITKDGRTFMVLGSPGGSRIITTLVEVISNIVDHGMTIQEAVNAPRIHHQWLPDEVYAEPFAISPDTRNILTGMGYKLTGQSPWGAAEAILIGPEKNAAEQASSGNDAMVGGGAEAGILYGANDDRRPAGAAIGY